LQGTAALPQFDHGFIAEKPSLAEAIAHARAEQLGVNAVKKDGYWEVGPDFVTWFMGHMYEQVGPDEYDPKWKDWSIQNLPIEIRSDQWKLKLNEADYIVAQMRRIKGNNLFKSAKVLVNAGDAEREGQLLVDEALLFDGIDPFSPAVKRLWVSSMARKDMLAALASLLPNADKRSLYDAAVCRQRADWLHGMNFSRLYTKLAEASGTRAKINVGRVMTPTLRLVVDRDRERLRFKPVDHYVPTPTFRHENGTFKAAWVVPADYDGLDSEGRLVDKSVAERICAKIHGKQGRVTAFKAETKFTAAPLPFSLSALQAECGSKLGMTAQEVLDTAQSLYERHKATTYPRSDSRHLPTAIYTDEAPNILRALSAAPALAEASAGVDPSIRSGAWDDAKVSDHHGIIPTSEFTASKLDAMSDTERAVFLIIAKTFLAQFYPPFKYKAISAEVMCEGETFKARGRQVLDQGWKKAFGAQNPAEGDEEDEEAEQAVPPMAQGDGVVAETADIAAKRTSPPPAFSDPTLITAMANVHRFVTNPDIKKRLKESDGIGTEATRAATIEKLLKLGLFKRRGKNGLESTEFGRSVIDVLPEDLKDPGLTALWESALEKVKRGELDANQFMEKTAASIAERIRMAKQGGGIVVKGVATVRPIEGHGEQCPKCGTGKLATQEVHKGEHKGKKYLRCDNPDCDYRRWPQPKVDPLPGHGKDCPACGKGKLLTREVTTKDGRKARLLSCSNYPTCRHGEWPQVEPIEGHGKPCAKCGTGKMLTREVKKEGPNKGKKFLGCDNPDCKNIEFPDDGNPLPGHGKPCPKCGQGVMKTKRGVSKKTGKPYAMLSCTNYPACNHSEFEEANVEPLPGHGNPCPKCGQGTLKTKEITSKKDGKKYRLLECSRRPDCDHSEWPERAPQADGPPLPGDGKTCPVCGKGKMVTKRGVSKKTGKPYAMLSCTNYPACNNSEFPDSGDRKGGGEGGGRRH
jgi:DNA topoisomerase-3